MSRRQISPCLPRVAYTGSPAGSPRSYADAIAAAAAADMTGIPGSPRGLWLFWPGFAGGQDRPGGAPIVTGGGGPAQRSTSTSAAGRCSPATAATCRTSARQHVRVAVHAQRTGPAPVDRVEPRAGRQLHHAAAARSSVSTAPARQAPRSLNTRTTSPSAMPRARGVVGVHPHRLAPGDLAGLAVRADVELAVQPRARAGWRSGAAGSAARAARRATRRARARPGGRGSRRSRSPRSSPRSSSIRPLGVRSGCAPGRRGSARTATFVAARSGSREPARRPELVERRGVDAAVGERGRATSPYRCSSHCRAVAALGERLGRRRAARPARRRCRSRRAPRRTGRRARCMAMRCVSLRARRRCRRARAWWSRGARCRRAAPSASSTARARRPCRAAPNARAQPVEVLVVVERVAAGPVHEPDVGIGAALRRRSRTARPGAAAGRRCGPPG